jgi:GntR family transcriptional regulator, transcriptional repressor for pyruvate dehydrogenase complex
VAISERDPKAAEDRMREHLEAYAVYARRKFPELLDQVISWDRLLK